MRIALRLLAVAAIASGGAIARSNGSPAAPPAVPESDFRRLCSGHVSAVPKADGRPGPHLEWTAYSSPLALDSLVKRQGTRLDAGEHETGEDGCHLWRFQDEGRHIWDLCPVEVETPARECAAPPPGTKSILVVSTMVGGN